ncbi:hypothetical protein PVL29_025827 [Vitis rotundifolia]|uniref:Uncharacterized protein n=2 Tax=Vitis rotundifolia TaxID=103349 RepID=A0AA38YKY0_VITRO|nr:hypothetical protein PVL29_025827 [Vitis rotundifolia]
MELQFSFFPILCTFLLFIFLLKRLGKPSRTNHPAPKLPPGPWKLPIIGNMHQLVGSLPHHSLRNLAKKHGPLMHLQLGEVSAIVVSSREMAKEVMKTHDIIFSQRPCILAASIVSYDCTDIAFAPYGGYWRQIRKISVLELLSAKRVQSFRSVREEEVLNLVRSVSLQEGVSINLTKSIFSLTFSIISRTVFGKKCKDQEAFSVTLDKFADSAGGFTIADVFPSIKLLHVVSGMRRKLEKIHKKLDRILENIINEHKARSAAKETSEAEVDDDLVDVLLKVQKQGDLEFPLTMDNIKAVLLDLFVAGSETSSTAVEWAMAEMLRNPGVMAKAQAEVRDIFSRKGHADETVVRELKYLKLVIKETLRLHPPVPLLIPRESRERCAINGYEIPVKTRVIINAWAIARDPKYWSDAESFNPERFLDSSIDYQGTNFEYIPFGAGRRMCPGILFGMANVELALAQLLYHFDWKLPNGARHEELDMTEGFRTSTKRKQDLYLIPITYRPLPVE